MTGLLIVLAVLVIPYFVLNVRRLRRGRSWAFSVCQVAKEWEERERAKHRAERSAERAKRLAARSVERAEASALATSSRKADTSRRT